MRWCVIPARGGSKRIPRKNLREFCGRPIIERSIDAALASELFEGVVVSTDDEEIAEIATAAGAAVPFLRVAALSDDQTPTGPVVVDAVERLRELGHVVERVCCLYATAPFVTPSDLERGLTSLDRSGADFSFAATTFAFPVQRSLVVGEDGVARPMFREHIGSRSQDLPEAIHDAGQFYWGATDAFCRFGIVFEGQAVPVMLPRHRVQDIDTPEDWEHAEAMFRVLQQAT